MTLSVSGARWRLREVAQERVDALARAGALAPVVARCLVLRGVEKADEAARFLTPRVADFHDPFAMKGMAAAVARIRQALSRREAVRVVTDYDVDGTTSSLIIQSVLGLLGESPVSYHIPHRMEEGYGFSVAAAEQAVADAVGLIITADIGVRDSAAIGVAAAAGVDVLVLDHHLPRDAEVPAQALAVLCPPQRGCTYPNPHLAACGIAFKLAQALLADLGTGQREILEASLLKMAAIGTVADVVEMGRGENRAMVALGLAALNRGGHRPGLEALLEVAGCTPGTITAEDLGFKIGPRINAAGRLASAELVVNLLRCGDRAAARQMAEALDAMNRDRREVQQVMVETALAEAEASADPFVVVAQAEGAGWHRGVAGIVAARVRDSLHRPAAVITLCAKEATGSMRSIAGVHAVRALDRAAHLLDRYGGHAVAAGFSLQADRIGELRAVLNASALEQVGGTMPEPEREVDVQLEASALGPTLLAQLDALAPHGKGNEVPVIWVPEVPRFRVEAMGEAHLRGTFCGGEGTEIPWVWFQGGEHLEALKEAREVALLGRFQREWFRGQERQRFRVDDAAVLA